jgi:predicted Zn-dependent peptidase
MDEEIARIKTEPVSEAELERVKTKMRANLVRQLDSDFGMALQMAEYQTKTGDWRNLYRYIEAIQLLTAEDIQRVANKYFDNQRRTVGEIVTESREGV